VLQSRWARWAGRPWRVACVLLFCALAAALLPVASAAAQTPNILRPGGSGAQDIKTLAIQVFAILSIVLVTVWVLLAVVVIRYRHRPESLASQTRGNLTIEIVWTLIPAVIVGVLFFLTVRTTHQLALPDTGSQFTTVGHQWWWEFDFPREGFKTANEVYVPVDRTVSIDVTSTDVIHSFWVPQMSGKMDMVPGRMNHITFVPLTKSSYLGECAEFCGAQHGKMKFLFIVVSTSDYANWVAHQRQPAAQPSGAQAVAGGQLIQTIACGGCHAIRGTSMKGTFAPDLTHFGSRSGIAAYSLANTSQNLFAWISNPQAAKPQSHMPQIPLPPQQISQLVAYLEELK
jgi:cytochrome c oxidase subunit II